MVRRADETPLEGGLSHSVEHLAFGPVGQPRFDCNAFVDGNRTSFHATGTDEEVAGFLSTVTTAIDELPLERLDREIAVLKREGARDDSIVAAHRHVRYGMWGHGLVGEPEFGLGLLSPERIQAWADAMFASTSSMNFENV